MKRRSISLIIGLMALALIGVVAMQYYFIRKSYLLQSRLFDESVHAAMGAVVQYEAKREMRQFLSEQNQTKNRILKQREEEHSRRARIVKLRKTINTFVEKEQELFTRFPAHVELENWFFETFMRKPVPGYPFRWDVVAQENDLVKNNQIRVYVEGQPPVLEKAKDDSVRYFIVDVLGNGGRFVVTLPPRPGRNLVDELRTLEQQEALEETSSFFDSVARKGRANDFQKLANEYEMSKRPNRQLVDYQLIEEDLKREFLFRGIKSDFYFDIQTNSQLIFRHSNFQYASDDASTYRIALNSDGPIPSSPVLKVSFPSKSRILLGSIHLMLFSSASLLLVLIGCFAYTIFIILRQKKISEMKTDFINNMTHEFKTPVATIMIASESLKDPEIVQNKGRVDRLANIIYDENVRLGSHIERVLNIARIDKGELKLDKKEVDVNELIPVVVDSMELQLQKREAKISLQLTASHALVMADELHLSNVLSNLIDNAIKYSKDQPEISITTRNTGKILALTVADKGIGMSKDQLSKIFDQFYRIPTGNRHDVKGFGLGLSYVNDIIKRLNGHIKVKSEKDKGTEFEITLPLYKATETIKD